MTSHTDRSKPSRSEVNTAASPSDWRSIPLKHTVLPAVAGDWGNEARGGGSDTVCVRVADFDFARGGLKSEIPTLRWVDPKSKAKRRLRHDDLLIEKSGGGEQQQVGRVVIVDRNLDRPTISSNFIARLRPLPGFDPRYLCYLHRAIYDAGGTFASTKQTTGIQNLDVGHYLAARHPFPPVAEQRRIADFLDRETDALAELISGKQRLDSLLVEKRARVALAAAGGELIRTKRREEFPLPWLPSMPTHWRLAKLSLVAQLGTGHTPSRSESKYWEGNREIPWLTTGDIERFRDDRLEVLNETKESISSLGLENSSAVLHSAGTVALSRTASVGFSVMMGMDMATSQDFATWTCSDQLEPRFLLLCLRAMRSDLVGRLATGSTHKTIYMPDIQSLRIPLPPLSEQQSCVANAEKRMSRIDVLSKLVSEQLPLLYERRHALITAAVAGELDPSSYRGSAVA